MAKNVKNKKKRSNYDDKLIMIIAASVGAALAVIVAAICIISYTGSYVAKVDGERIMKYEYEYFLTNAKQEMENDAVEAGTLAEDADANAIAEFWTDAKKKEAADKALEEAKKWKAQYILAEEKGFDLGYKERNEYKQNLEYQIYSQYSQYSSYYTYDAFVEMYLGGMSLKDYQSIAIQSAAISAYKEDMKEDYTTTDDELRNLYNETPDDFRKINMSVLALAKPTKPTEVKAPEEGTDKKESDFSSTAEWTKYSEALKSYNEYKEKLTEYETKLKEVENRQKAILEALKKDGKYTEEKKEDAKEESKDDAKKDSASTENKDSADSKYVYKDATLADIAAKEGVLFTEEKGAVTINSVSKSGYDTLDELALNMQWKDDTHKVIVCVKDDQEVADYNGGETVDGITYTQYVAVSDDSYCYVLRCVGIDDFDTSKESKEGAEDSVKDAVKRQLYEDRATETLEKKVKDAGKKFNVKGKKQAEIDKIVKSVSWN